MCSEQPKTGLETVQEKIIVTLTIGTWSLPGKFRLVTQCSNKTVKKSLELALNSVTHLTPDG